ncbi:hypothetical protein GCM10023193_43760 [Planotetraspora kaengkrachanensis]|uniref:Uncharacterized protein n=1 Tax=Planotetraspora kaengkrachanensis TaxID=575193 RepID=A0A8J3PYJ7_9ACTN|nr:hypothetical protein Pka01_65810 [Planotetraspora kaengkrachanensis]
MSAARREGLEGGAVLRAPYGPGHGVADRQCALREGAAEAAADTCDQECLVSRVAHDAIAPVTDGKGHQRVYMVLNFFNVTLISAPDG